MLLTVLYATFIVAYFSDTNMAVITVNDFGEGVIEFIILSIVMMLVVTGYVCEWRGEIQRLVQEGGKRK